MRNWVLTHNLKDDLSYSEQQVATLEVFSIKVCRRHSEVFKICGVGSLISFQQPGPFSSVFKEYTTQ